MTDSESSTSALFKITNESLSQFTHDEFENYFKHTPKVKLSKEKLSVSLSGLIV